MKICQSMWIQWPFFSKPWTKGHWPLDVLWPQVCWGHMCDSTQGSLCPSPMKIHQSMWWIQWPFFFFKNLNQRSLTPRWPLTPHLLRSCVTLPKDHCVQVPWEYIDVCGYSDQFCKTPRIRTYYIHTTYKKRTEWVITSLSELSSGEIKIGLWSRHIRTHNKERPSNISKITFTVLPF